MDALQGTLASRKWRAALALVLTVLVAAGQLWYRDAPLVSAIEGTALAWRFVLRGAETPPDNVAILAIDDRTVTQIRRWPLPRSAIADAVAKLTAYDAAAVGIDLMFLDREQSPDGIALGPGDLALRDALRAAPNAVISFAFTFGPKTTIAAEAAAALRSSAYRVVQQSSAGQARGMLRAADALMPIEPFHGVAGMGHVNVPVDQDGALRHVHPAIAIENMFAPALAVEVARRFMRLSPDEVALLIGRGLALGDRIVPTDQAMRVPIAYYGPASAIDTYSMIDLLEGRIPRERFAGRAVLIGATAVGVGDTFASPYSRALPGVEVLATVVANLINAQTIDHGARAMMWDVIAILVLALAAYAAAHLPSPAIAFLSCLALLVAWFVSAQIAFNQGWIWLSVLFPSLSVIANAGVVGGSRFARERWLRRDVERQRSNLARYHSPLVADMLAQTAGKDLAEREQNAAILFVDLAGFTRRSEHMTPSETAHFLRNFHSRVERAALAEGGVLEQFTGDGAMVIFGLPAPSDNDAVAAMRCALALAADITSWSREIAPNGEAPMRVGVGLHYGPVLIARVGGQKQIHLTATGDTVNVASRLEALTRTFDATIVASDALVRAVRASGRIDLLAGFESLPPQVIRGRDEKIGIWIGRPNQLAHAAAQKK
ncbi:MAG TPA: adenylate/guanylate cyclase domain-containing protein [Alphaproteobacteria bacterium]|nr:adenylate/guanylate cyclase domain-containing protein [Alphaproteobacteria bacterium]